MTNLSAVRCFFSCYCPLIFLAEEVFIYPCINNVPRQPFICPVSLFCICCCIYACLFHCLSPFLKIKCLSPRIKPASQRPCLLDQRSKPLISSRKNCLKKTHIFPVPLKLKSLFPEYLFQIFHLPLYALNVLLTMPLKWCMGFWDKWRDTHIYFYMPPCVRFCNP